MNAAATDSVTRARVFVPAVRYVAPYYDDPGYIAALGDRVRAAIDAHPSYLDQHGAVYSAIYRGGLAIAPEVGKVVEEHREVVLRWFLRNMGIVRPRPVLRTALRAWISMVEGASLDWIAHRELERSALRELLTAGYFAVLHKAVELDPKAAASAPIRARRGARRAAR